LGIRDLFRKRKKTEPEPLSNLTLSGLKPGFFVDYDLKTWEVVAYNYYDWGEGEISHEWQLKSADDLVYLEKESDDEEDWSLNHKIPFGRVGSELRAKIIENGDPPEQIVFEGRTYYMEEMAGGHFYKDGVGPGREFLRWSFEDQEGKHYLGIEQWDEEDFEASIGKPVEEYQFTNILPGAGAQK
jgi:hypothetical protein